MKNITIKIVLNDLNQMALVEAQTGLDMAKIEDQLLMIGILDNIKQKHLDKLKTLYDKTVRRDDGKKDL